MPYKTISELPERIRKALPKKAQQLFLKVFNEAYVKYGDTTAFKIAWAAVKKKYQPSKSGKWVLHSDGVVMSYEKFLPIGDEDKEVRRYIEFVVTSPSKTTKGERFHPQFIKTVGNQLQGIKGDLEHANLLNLDLPKMWIIKVLDSRVIGNEIHATAMLNYLHPYYETVWEMLKEGKLGASIEVEYDDGDFVITDEGRVYFDGNVIGISLTTSWANPDSQVYALYEVKEKR
ncbi:MAG: hypothetical protein DRN17_00400 [Thermoplasmata archaeon]|nr:MAG: hypothetical protein DRN17_00400 [Thermoplasmata archaeon]